MDDLDFVWPKVKDATDPFKKAVRSICLELYYLRQRAKEENQ